MIIKHRWANYEHSRDYNTGNLDKLVKVFPHVILAANLQGLGWVSYMVADVLQLGALLGLAGARRLDALA